MKILTKNMDGVTVRIIFTVLVHTLNQLVQGDLGPAADDRMIKHGKIHYRLGSYYTSALKSAIICLAELEFMFRPLSDDIYLDALFGFSNCLILIGFLWLRHVARNELGILYSKHVGLHQGHALVIFPKSAALYGQLIHPDACIRFLAPLFTLSYLEMPHHRFYLYLLFLLLTFSEFQTEIVTEENMMTEQFGDLYLEYHRERWRFAPFIKFEFGGFKF